jgi:hypothetical protein
LAIVDWVLLIFEMITTPGTLLPSAAVRAIKLAYFAIPIWGWAMTCIKISIAMTLLRIKDTVRWKIFFYSIAGLQAAYCVGNTVFIFTLCTPLAAAWNLSVTISKCSQDSKVLIASNVGSSINILTDILLSLSPITFLRKLNRPARERVLLCVLMGLGLLATICSIVKTVAVQSFGKSDDRWTWALTIATWTVLEQFVAVLAACAPFMKPLLERVLSYLGLPCVIDNSEISTLHTFDSKTTTNPSQQNQAAEEVIKCPSPVYYHSDVAEDTTLICSPISTSRSFRSMALDAETNSKRLDERRATISV